MEIGGKVEFGKFEGGKMTVGVGTLEEVDERFVRVAYVDDDGARHTCRFRRIPGPQAGWGVGPSKFWRLSDVERRKYCHPDTPRGKR